jgi:cyclopropane fatty-acyl-phospholipid synthase-like methyltransferase
MPERSLQMANQLKLKFPNKRFFDFGCAKGFLMYAFWLLNVECFGYDISSYAIAAGKKEIRNKIYTNKESVPVVDVVVSKDVLEHIPYDLLDDELTWIKTKGTKFVFVVPLGDNEKYRIPAYEFDKSHIIRENEEWWLTKFKNLGFIIDEFHYSLLGYKDSWTNIHPYGNAIFFLSIKGDK